VIVNIQSNKIELDKALEVHIERKLRLALSNMEPLITAVTISLSDVVRNNAVSGIEEVVATQCGIQVSIENIPAIEVVDIQSDLYYAIDRVIQKASRTMTRKLFYSGNVKE